MSVPNFLQALGQVVSHGYSFVLTENTLALQRQDGRRVEIGFDLNARDMHSGTSELAALLLQLGDAELAVEIEPAARLLHGAR